MSNMSNIWYWVQLDTQRAIGAFLVAYVVSLLLTPVVIKVARARGLVAEPSSERWHRQPTALFGGAAIFAASLLPAVLFLPLNPHFVGVGVGMFFIFLVGLYDDCKPLPPVYKLIAQLVAACFFVIVFYGAVQRPTFVWLVPFAIVWIVGITNAFNLLDNMDGLSAGVATVVAVLMAVRAIMVGDMGVAVGALILAGAAAGFLVYNFNPARIFMGDCGSMFLGFSLACLALMSEDGLLSGNLFSALLLPTLVLATPLFDTIFVSCVRFLHGRPISQGGRDHTSHRLVLLGLSERRAVCWLYAITFWFGLVALWGSTIRNNLATIVVTILSVIAMLVFGLFLAEVQTYSQEEYERARTRSYSGKTILSRVIWHKRRFVEAFLDFGLICVCLTAAFLLRFEGQLNEGSARTLGLALPYVVACQMIAFHVVGLYRGLWRYVTISDIGTAVRGVVVGTLAAYGLIWVFLPLQFPRSTLVIYAALLLITAVGMRLGLKALRYHFALRWHGSKQRVLVIGAGDAGELVVNEMLSNKALQLHPVGFLDDDPTKRYSSIHGVPVLGSRNQLLDTIKRMNIDEVIVAMPSIGNGVVQEVVESCQRHGISCREVRGVIL